MYNNVRLLKWLHSNGCPLHSWALRYAISWKNLELVKWLFANNCSWSYRMFDECVVDPGIKNWLNENNHVILY